MSVAVPARLLARLFALAALALVPATASAATFTPASGAQLTNDLVTAATNGQDDTITISGPTLTVTGVIVYQPGPGDVDRNLLIEGGGNTITTTNGPATAFDVSNPSGLGLVTLKNLTVATVASTTLGIRVGGPTALDHVTVTGPMAAGNTNAVQSGSDLTADALTLASPAQQGLYVVGGTATVSNSTIGGASSRLVQVVSGDLVLQDSLVHQPANAGATGVEADSDSSTTTLRRLRIDGTYVAVNGGFGGDVTIADSLITGITGGGTALRADDSGNDTPYASTVTADRLTIVGTDEVSQWVAEASGGSASEADAMNVVLRDSIAVHVPNGFNCGEGGQSTNTITVLRSDVPEATTDNDGCKDGQVPGITRTAVTTADPQFVDEGAGDYRLKATSPLIDSGPLAAELPAPAALDLARATRVRDGDGDCAAKADLGAYEYQPSTPDCAPPAPPADPVPGTPSPAATPVPPGAGPDRLAPVLSALKLTPRRDAKTGRLILRVRFTVSEPGTVRLTLLKRKGRRLVALKGAATTLTATKAGAVSATWKTTVRATTGARFRLQAKPKDRAGNGGGTKAAAVLVP